MNKIKELRLKHGDTLKDLAEKINYDFSYLSKDKSEGGREQPFLYLKIPPVGQLGCYYVQQTLALRR